MLQFSEVTAPAHCGGLYCGERTREVAITLHLLLLRQAGFDGHSYRLTAYATSNKLVPCFSEATSCSCIVSETLDSLLCYIQWSRLLVYL